MCAKIDEGAGEIARLPAESGEPFRFVQVANTSIDVALNDEKFSYISNFDGDKMNHWRLKALACGPDAMSFEQMPDGVMDLKYFYCHLIEMVSKETGEMVTCIRTALISDDGRCYSFVSDYIAREIDGLVQMWGSGPWDPALRIKVTKFLTRNRNQCYSIGPA